MLEHGGVCHATCECTIGMRGPGRGTTRALERDVPSKCTPGLGYYHTSRVLINPTGMARGRMRIRHNADLQTTQMGIISTPIPIGLETFGYQRKQRPKASWMRIRFRASVRIQYISIIISTCALHYIMPCINSAGIGSQKSISSWRKQKRLCAFPHFLRTMCPLET